MERRWWLWRKRQGKPGLAGAAARHVGGDAEEKAWRWLSSGIVLTMKTNRAAGTLLVAGAFLLGCVVDADVGDDADEEVQEQRSILAGAPGTSDVVDAEQDACFVAATCPSYDVRDAANAKGLTCALAHLVEADDSLAIAVSGVSAERELVRWEIISGSHGRVHVRTTLETHDGDGELDYLVRNEVCELTGAPFFKSCLGVQGGTIECASPDAWFGSCRDVTAGCELVMAEQ
jgi:hypothetical protein